MPYIYTNARVILVESTTTQCPDCGCDLDVSNRIAGDIILCPECDAAWLIQFIPVESKQ